MAEPARSGVSDGCRVAVIQRPIEQGRAVSETSLVGAADGRTDCSDCTPHQPNAAPATQRTKVASLCDGIMWAKPDGGGINGNAGDNEGLAKLSRSLHRNGVSKDGDVDNLLGSVKSGNGSNADKDVGDWVRRAVYQVGKKNHAKWQGELLPASIHVRQEPKSRREVIVNSISGVVQHFALPPFRLAPRSLRDHPAPVPPQDPTQRLWIQSARTGFSTQAPGSPLHADSF